MKCELCGKEQSSTVVLNGNGDCFDCDQFEVPESHPSRRKFQDTLYVDPYTDVVSEIPAADYAATCMPRDERLRFSASGRTGVGIGIERSGDLPSDSFFKLDLSGSFISGESPETQLHIKASGSPEAEPDDKGEPEAETENAVLVSEINTLLSDAISKIYDLSVGMDTVAIHQTCITSFANYKHASARLGYYFGTIRRIRDIINSPARLCGDTVTPEAPLAKPSESELDSIKESIRLCEKVTIPMMEGSSEGLANVLAASLNDFATELGYGGVFDDVSISDGNIVITTSWEK